ncbi:MAG: hypothetical protein WC523_02265 [Patescibacteria group bacterium]
MKTIWKKYVNLLIVSLLALIFFMGTASFNYLTQDKNYTKWSSPDETANYFFSKRLSDTGQIAVFDSAAVIGDNLVMPRSLRSDFGWLKPVSFLGIILIYGSIGSLVGSGVIPFLTPFFAALGIIFFYLLARKVFSSERIGLLAACLLATFPVYIYYTVRSMFHNILFIVFLIIGFYLLVLALNRREKIKKKFFSLSFRTRPWAEFLFSFLSGVFVGLALITRTSELLWLLPTLFIVWVFYVRRVGLTKLILFLAGLFLTLLPIVYWNKVLYNSPFYGGYNEMNRSLDDISQSGGQIFKLTLAGQINEYQAQFQRIAKNIFYFGFNPQQSISMFRHYVLEMFPILLYVGLFGLLLLLGKNIRHFQRKYLVYSLVGLILSVILVFYYGSWRFNDNPDPTRFTIGNSYTRYWLPIYLWLMPLVALAIVRISHALLLIKSDTRARLRKIIAAGLQAGAVLIIAFLNLIFVLYGSEEGLAYLYYNVKQEKINTEKVLALTEPESIIITRYYDKFFFPERRIIMGTLPNDEVLTAVKKLVNHYPVYYYNFYLNEADVTYLNERKLLSYELEMKKVKKINSQFGLYRIEKLEDSKIEKLEN